MKGKKDRAVECFTRGYACSQAVLSTYAPMVGLDRESALRVSCGFGGGMGRLQNTCGAVTGAFMVIGCKYGKVREDDGEAKGKTYDLVKIFADRFKAVNGSINCRELLGCDLNTEEGMKFAEENNLFSTKCEKYVRDAAGIIEDMLFREEE
jgi:C_GCAxxG_C_C family probable redox protein